MLAVIKKGIFCENDLQYAMVSHNFSDKRMVNNACMKINLISASASSWFHEIFFGESEFLVFTFAHTLLRNLQTQLLCKVKF